MRKNYLIYFLVFSWCTVGHFVNAAEISPISHRLIDSVPKVQKATLLNATSVDIVFDNRQRLTIDFYGGQIFRLFQDNNKGVIREPEASPAATILVNNPRKPVGKIELLDTLGQVVIATAKIKFVMEKETGLFSIVNLASNSEVLRSVEPIGFEGGHTALTLSETRDEYFFGGGVQNGRFSHKGKSIAIENQNSWTDGGVASPNPFYWSTRGYGILWHTFKKGKYDFGATEHGKVRLQHDTDYLDIFIMVDEGAAQLLRDFYQLTGNPVLLPKFGFYQGHLNAYNRDYWLEDEQGIPFEDGKRYKESQKDNGGIKESLNGELGNYQFSARAVIDRYKAHDMPLGWILPNDGYGAGYGQTQTLEGNIENLREFGDYARRNGVEVGLWTQSDLHPRDSIAALLQRDIISEVRDAGVRGLKTDVAWVGAGYSFGLNGVSDVGHTMPYYGGDARPFIISLDGWAGTQRYAGIWSGDQTGGLWEYIRFHIPTYIGSGLSGNPNISSDMDGIFGGKNPVVNIRDFQWKTFTPMQLNMDGWGSNIKYPHALGEPATSINRTYLKWKSELMPYSYSIAHEAVTGLPMVRAMFLESANRYTLGSATQYQFMYGPSFLVAPIYKDTRSDEQGNDIRDMIYLPEGEWIDYFSGQKFSGNKVLNSVESPIWKLPVFVKNGAIIPLANANNNVSEIDASRRLFEIYPAGQTSFTTYDDDGKTEAYRNSAYAKSEIRVNQQGKTVEIMMLPTIGTFSGFAKAKTTEFIVHASQPPARLSAKIGHKKVKLTKADTEAAYHAQEAAFYYMESADFNRFATSGSAFSDTIIDRGAVLLIKLPSVDVSQESISVKIDGFVNEPLLPLTKTGKLAAPAAMQVNEGDRQAYALRPSWKAVGNADYYELMFDSLLYSTVRDTSLLFEGLVPETDYQFQLRAVNSEGTSDWAVFSAGTKSNPLEFAIRGITGSSSTASQDGEEIDRLFDFDESNMWHTRWDEKAVPFTIVADLGGVNQLDKLHYLPRAGKGNGVWLRGAIAYSMDRQSWTEAGTFTWENTGETKIFAFGEHLTARYVRLTVTEGVGGFGSGRELYIFRQPGTESYLPGDINHDGLLDANDLTSYTNYMGLRLGDADFEGYVSNGDINKNGLIDAYDVSAVTTQLDGGVAPAKAADKLSGKIIVQPDKTVLQEGDILELRVKAVDLSAVNALSFALPYDQQQYEFIGMTPLALAKMQNLTVDRLHSNGAKALYPTFVNIGDQVALAGSADLFVIRLKARKRVDFTLKIKDGFLVDKAMNVLQF